MHQRRDDELTTAAQLELDDHLFRSVEFGTATGAYRIWESARPVVVLGRNGRAGDHINQDACREDGVEILRRSSGGGPVVLGPGCLNYAVVLSVVSRPDLIDVTASFRLILTQIAVALQLPDLTLAGDADLALGGRKVSGNAQRRGRRALLHHGTLLYAFDSAVAVRYLREPARQPGYRMARRHDRFLTNISLERSQVSARLAAALLHLLRDA
jgi:lipoate-protein ligase A